jgi:hypothetical protein
MLAVGNGIERVRACAAPRPGGDSPYPLQLVARVELRVTRLYRIPLRPQRAASLNLNHSCSLTPFGPRQMFEDPVMILSILPKILF